MLTAEHRNHLVEAVADAYWHDDQHHARVIEAALATIDEQAEELALLRRVVRGATEWLSCELGPDADDALAEWDKKYGGQGK